MNSGTVKRVVLTSSISTITAKDGNGNARVVDESCQTPIDQVLTAKARGWVNVSSSLSHALFLQLENSQWSESIQLKWSV